MSTGNHNLSLHRTNPLYEKTLDVHKDSELIYNKVFDKFISDLINKKFSNNYLLDFQRENDIMLYKTTTKELISKDCVRANSLLESNLYVGIFTDGSRVDFDLDNYTSDIYLSLNYDVFKELYLNGFNLERARNIFSNIDITTVLSKSSIKATISHELSHWVSNILYNQHIVNKHRGFIDRQRTKPNSNPKFSKISDKSYFEIDAQIHGIELLKQDWLSNRKNWNSLSIDDLFNLYQPLKFMSINLIKEFGKDAEKNWRKELYKRMSRENLLGKNMRIK